MDCVKIGNLIAKLRKEKNLPREILQMHWVFKIKLLPQEVLEDIKTYLDEKLISLIMQNISVIL